MGYVESDGGGYDEGDVSTTGRLAKWRTINAPLLFSSPEAYIFFV